MTLPPTRQIMHGILYFVLALAAGVIMLIVRRGRRERRGFDVRPPKDDGTRRD